MRGEREEWSHLLVMVSVAQHAELHVSIHAMCHVSDSRNSVCALWYWLQAVSGCGNGASPCRVCVR